MLFGEQTVECGTSSNVCGSVDAETLQFDFPEFSCGNEGAASADFGAGDCAGQMSPDMFSPNSSSRTLFDDIRFDSDAAINAAGEGTEIYIICCVQKYKIYPYILVLRSIITPGLHANSQLLYTLDEKQLYCRKNLYKDFDRYVCRIPGCKAAVNRSKPGELVTRANTQTHDDPNQEDAYLKCRFESKCKLQSAVADSSTTSSVVFRAEAEK